MKKKLSATTGTKGFTLIELLVVIAIIAILAVLVFVALNPVQRFADTRNSRRWTDVNSILTAIHEYAVDNDGEFPDGVTALASGTTAQIGTGAGGVDCGKTGEGNVCGDGNCVDLSAELAPYFASIPLDPQETDDARTGYAVKRTEAGSGGVGGAGFVTVSACNAEMPETAATIQVTR